MGKLNKIAEALGLKRIITEINKEKRANGIKGIVAEPKHKLKYTKTGIPLNRNGAPMIGSPFTKHIDLKVCTRIIGHTKSY